MRATRDPWAAAMRATTPDTSIETRQNPVVTSMKQVAVVRMSTQPRTRGSQALLRLPLPNSIRVYSALKVVDQSIPAARPVGDACLTRRLGHRPNNRGVARESALDVCRAST